MGAYLLAAAVSGSAFCLRYLLVAPGDARFPLFLATPVALACAAALGFRPALLALGVSLALPAWFVLEPVGALRVADGVTAAVMVASTAVAGLAAWAVDRGVALFGRNADLLAANAELHRELLHRTKNDLMVVVSLIRMKARDAADPTAREALLGVAAIVQNAHHVHDAAVAGVAHHDDTIDSAGFLGTLCGKLRAVPGAVIERHPIGHAAAKPLGYLLVELVSGVAGDEAVVTFRRDDGHFVLAVDEPDDGRRVAGGGRLAQGLASSLGGRLEAAEGEGPGRKRYVLRFPVAKGA